MRLILQRFKEESEEEQGKLEKLLQDRVGFVRADQGFGTKYETKWFLWESVFLQRIRQTRANRRRE